MMEDWKELINTYIGMEKHKMTVAGEITGANDLASEIWLRANTKNCPKCKVKIQKNDGCNHMTCKHCTHEFCWICMGPWKEHGNNTGGFFRCVMILISVFLEALPVRIVVKLSCISRSVALMCIISCSLELINNML